MPMPVHMTLEGEKQGAIKGNCTMMGREGTIMVQAFEHNIYIPSDVQTGLTAGKRVHDPMKIVKEIDKASPMLYQALCTGEHLKKVEIKWYRISSKGTEEHYFTTTLEDATIVSIFSWAPNCLDKAAASYGHLQEVSFTYRKIGWRHEVDKIEAQDDWITPME